MINQPRDTNMCCTPFRRFLPIRKSTSISGGTKDTSNFDIVPLRAATTFPCCSAESSNWAKTKVAVVAEEVAPEKTEGDEQSWTFSSFCLVLDSCSFEEMTKDYSLVWPISVSKRSNAIETATRSFTSALFGGGVKILRLCSSVWVCWW